MDAAHRLEQAMIDAADKAGIPAAELGVVLLALAAAFLADSSPSTMREIAAVLERHRHRQSVH